MCKSDMLCKSDILHSQRSKEGFRTLKTQLNHTATMLLGMPLNIVIRKLFCVPTKELSIESKTVFKFTPTVGCHW